MMKAMSKAEILTEAEIFRWIVVQSEHDTHFEYKSFIAGCKSPEAPELWYKSLFPYPNRAHPWHQRTEWCHGLGYLLASNVTVHENGFFGFGDRIIQSDPFIVRYHFVIGIDIDSIISRKRERVDDSVILVFDHGYRNYGHWLVDILPRLLFLKMVAPDVLTSFNIVLPSDTPDWILKILFISLGVTHENILLLDFKSSSYEFRQVIVPTILHRYYLFHPFIIVLYDQLVEKLNENLETSQEDIAPYLFLAKQNPHQGERLLRNRDDILKTAESCGLQICCPEESFSSWEQEVKQFSRTKLIVGEYSSSLHNSLLMKNGTGVIALNPLQYLQSYLCAVRQQRTMYMYPEGSDGIYKAGAYSIDCSLFKRGLNLALERANNS